MPPAVSTQRTSVEAGGGQLARERLGPGEAAHASSAGSV